MTCWMVRSLALKWVLVRNFTLSYHHGEMQKSKRVSFFCFPPVNQNTCFGFGKMLASPDEDELGLRKLPHPASSRQAGT